MARPSAEPTVLPNVPAFQERRLGARIPPRAVAAVGGKRLLGRRTGLLLSGRRHYHAHLKHQGAILYEFLPLCDDVALQ